MLQHSAIFVATSMASCHLPTMNRCCGYPQQIYMNKLWTAVASIQNLSFFLMHQNPNMYSFRELAIFKWLMWLRNRPLSQQIQSMSQSNLEYSGFRTYLKSRSTKGCCSGFQYRLSHLARYLHRADSNRALQACDNKFSGCSDNATTMAVLATRGYTFNY